jgi:AcrR family transcriptional regulator
MQGLADAVGVSRQTVYNEVRGKEPLAEALVLDELDRFLGVVNEAFDDHPTDLVQAIRAAVEGVLVHARGNALLRAVVSATHGARTELLPLLTTHSESLLSTAKTVLFEALERYPIDLDADERDAAVDVVVRVVLSHVMQPSGSPAATAADIAWIAHRVLSAPSQVAGSREARVNSASSR